MSRILRLKPSSYSSTIIYEPTGSGRHMTKSYWQLRSDRRRNEHKKEHIAQYSQHIRIYD